MNCKRKCDTTVTGTQKVNSDRETFPIQTGYTESDVSSTMTIATTTTSRANSNTNNYNKTIAITLPNVYTTG